MEQLKHFSHHHLLYLVRLKQTHIIQNSSSNDNEEQEEEEDDDSQVVVQEDDQQHGGQCKMCEEWIYSFHLCYYRCHECDYSLHKFCAELPLILKSHPLHPGHELTLSKEFQFTDPDPFFNFDSDRSFNFKYRFDSEWTCGICIVQHKMFYNYHCSICKFNMDIVCATMSQQKMDHPSHPHQLERMFKSTLANCGACGRKHEGTFYHCTICSWFWIHLDCALLPTKLSIQQSTKDSFTHFHLLTLAYSFPYIEQKAKSFPLCKVCDDGFHSYKWLYKCDKCRYYVHVQCAASKTEPFMSIFLSASLGKTFKNFKDDDQPNLLHCPFPDESCNLLKHYFYNRREFFVKEKDDNRHINHFSHPHPLILFDTQASLCNKSISLHDPMKKIQVLCDGCVKPITSVPFYKCSQYNVENNCGFVLHEWCAKLPSEVHDHPGHPEHTLVLLPKIPSKLLGVFRCEVCRLLSNGFAYGCTKCEYYVDINCSLIPKEITYEGHPNHLLFRVKGANMPSTTYCRACRYYISVGSWGFHCSSCDFYMHTRCALLLPREIRHKYDKHPLSLRYGPVENHPQEYFCEICEDQMVDLRELFYHCTTCAWSMHAACAPLILQSEQAVYSKYESCVFEFINVKFGGKVEMEGHPHSVAFVQGIESHGQCNMCDEQLQYNMIFKCLECDQFAIHYECAVRRLL